MATTVRRLTSARLGLRPSAWRTASSGTAPASPTRLSLRPSSLAAISPSRPHTAHITTAAFHGSAARLRGRVGHNNEPVPDGPPTTDFSRMDIFGDTPAPATAIDVCMPDGFALNSGSKVMGGNGILLVGGEAFAWRPWTAAHKLVNAKGQWEVPAEAFGLLGLVWPRPDLLILGLGPELRPLSPATRQLISSLGIRVDVLDTRNAASQFNLLATERGVGEVAAAMIPIGWKEGVGAV